MSSKRWQMIIPLTAVALFGGWCFLGEGTDPRVVRARELQQQIAEGGEHTSSMWDEFIDVMAELSEEQRAEFHRLNQAEHTAQLRRFFTLSEEEQSRTLDNMIDTAEARVKEAKSQLRPSSARQTAALSVPTDIQRQTMTETQQPANSLTPEEQFLHLRYLKALNDRRVARSASARQRTR